MAIKKCTDSRVDTTDLDLLLQLEMVHEWTAGNVVRAGHMFRTLKSGGLGIVMGHQSCGACNAAYDYQKAINAHTKTTEIDPRILEILMTIPVYVREIADPTERSQENAIAQTYFAQRILASGEKKVSIVPTFYTWEGEQNLERLDSATCLSPDMNTLATTARRITGHALAEGRDFSTQYAALTVLHDPYRLGRINDPRVIVGALGNEMFCVTSDLRPFDSNPQKEKHLSTTAMGSVMYAGYDKANGHYGHVRGVGGPDGTHILGILDISEDVLRNVKRFILETYSEIKTFTDNGELILLMHYNPDTAEVKFLKD